MFQATLLGFLFLKQNSNLHRPVIMITRIPAALHSWMELITSLRGGSSIPTQPTKVKSVLTASESKWFSDLPLPNFLLIKHKLLQGRCCVMDWHHSLTSYSPNLVESSRFISSFLRGVSRVARARQRSVSRPVPHSLITPMMWSFTGPVRGTRAVPTRMYAQRSMTPSGAP